MTRALAIAAHGAEAHCYTRWFYPHPQPGCGVAHAAPQPRRAIIPPADPSAIAPGDLEKLKAAMKGRS